MSKNDFYKKYVIKEDSNERVLEGEYKDYQAFLILEKLSNLKMPSLLKSLVLQLMERDYADLQVIIDNFKISNDTCVFSGKIYHGNFTVNSSINISLAIAYDVFKYEITQRYPSGFLPGAYCLWHFFMAKRQLSQIIFSDCLSCLNFCRKSEYFV